MEQGGTDILAALAHDSAWHAARASGIGGSDVTRLMAGDWLPLWEEKTGRMPGPDLEDVLPVKLGQFTEPFNAAWFTKQTGIAVSRDNCAGLVHPQHGFMRCNLDGITAGGIFEAKHTSAFSKSEEIVERYFPQLQHNMIVTGVGNAYLSVIFGNHKWEYFEIAADPGYQIDLIAMETEFWSHVVADDPPMSQGAAPSIAIAFDDMREADMEGSNEWAAAAADWLEHRLASKTFTAATGSLKDLTEPDVKRAHGHGVETRRAKNGSIRIGEMK